MSDRAFDEVYPAAIRALAYRHWTPLDVAKKAADFLITANDTRVLDIGSGVGKFCLAAAHYKPSASFVGIEQRPVLVQHASAAKKILSIPNAEFLTGNFTGIDFSRYNHFYLYNPFYENLAGTPKIDDSLQYSTELFE
ncbi:MAG: class I SAM-dependent methyltransferase, partial [Chitinophagaceae bacterium]